MARNMNRRTCPEPAAIPKANTVSPTARQNTASSTARRKARRAWRRRAEPQRQRHLPELGERVQAHPPNRRDQKPPPDAVSSV